MDIPNNLDSWQDFFNFEAERIIDLSEAQLEQRIKDYSKILQAVQAMSWASIKRLEAIVSEEKRKILPSHLENLKARVPVTGKERSERVSKEEGAIRSLMKTLKVDRAAAEDMIKKMKSAEWDRAAGESKELVKKIEEEEKAEEDAIKAAEKAERLKKANEVLLNIIKPENE